MKQRYYSAFMHQARKIVLTLGLSTLGVLALMLQGCDQISRTDEIKSAETNVTSTDVGNLSGSDSEMIGKEVTIRNQVIKTVDPNGFTMTSDGGSPILVINSTGVPFILPSQNIPVQATGMVESFVVADMQKKYGLNLDPTVYRDYDRQPVIVAKSLALAPTVEDLASMPAGYFNKTIAVKGQVRKIDTSSATPNAFALFEDGWVDDIGVLVIGVDNKQKSSLIQEGEYVVVTGAAQQPDTALLEKGLGWDAPKTQEFLSRYQNRPIIVAQDVYPSAVPKQ